MTGSLRETGLNQLLTSLNFHENLPIHHILVTEKGAKIEEKLLNQYTFWFIDRKKLDIPVDLRRSTWILFRQISDFEIL